MLDGTETTRADERSEAEHPTGVGGGRPAEGWEETARRFRAEAVALGAEARRRTGPEDVAHLRRLERWGRISDIAGLALALRRPSVIASALLAQGANTRWALQHHISHGAYDRIDGAPARYSSEIFARGWRRPIDWLDWIEPEAWHQEHDLAHHHRLGEDEDPDLIERNFAWLRDSSLPRWLGSLLVLSFGAVWKPVYYAPSTLRVQMENEARRDGTPRPGGRVLDPRHPYGRRFWARCVAPRLIGRYLLPTLIALMLPSGRRRARALLINLVAAEVVENLQGFATITPGHTGDDLYRFADPARVPGEHHLRQVVGTTNFTLGGDLNDHLHLWLNYQIEHHLWPDLTLLQYRRIAPELQALCRRHAIPYRCQSLPRRLVKMLRIATGRDSMQWGPPYPLPAAEPGPAGRSNPASQDASL